MTHDPLDFDPLDESGTSSDKGKKAALLVGGNPKSKDVYYGVKLALYRGRSINRYDLTSGQRVKKNRGDFSSDEEMDKAIEYYLRVGHAVTHPAIREENVPEWIAHFKKEAKRLGLNVVPRSTS